MAQRYKTVVERIDQLSFNVKAFRLRLQEPPAMAFTPGQFIIAHVPKNGQVVKRAYSIASPPQDEGVIELCLQIVEGGAASTYFNNLTAGSTVTLDGPHGKFTLPEPLTDDPVFLAMGTGVAPFRSMLRDLLRRGVRRELWLLLGVRFEHAILYHQEFQQLAREHANFHYVPTVSRPTSPQAWPGEVGHVQDSFKRHITDYTQKRMYVCGFLQIVKDVVKDLTALGVPKEQVHYEEW
ncbi:MAG: hypothetical protein HY597_04550 [Candidatus Omnitrophica bacterium]|nr:hypothetical protein [Candidatus Omnitrophota bacterium]